MENLFRLFHSLVFGVKFDCFWWYDKETRKLAIHFIAHKVCQVLPIVAMCETFC